MFRKKYITNKYLIKDLVLFPTKVLKIEEQNKPINDKLKTVFYCKSQTKPEGIMCVSWGRTSIDVGDTVELKGRLKNNVFIAWEIQIKNKSRGTTSDK